MTDWSGSHVHFVAIHQCSMSQWKGKTASIQFLRLGNTGHKRLYQYNHLLSRQCRTCQDYSYNEVWYSKSQMLENVIFSCGKILSPYYSQSVIEKHGNEICQVISQWWRRMWPDKRTQVGKAICRSFMRTCHRAPLSIWFLISVLFQFQCCLPHNTRAEW